MKRSRATYLGATEKKKKKEKKNPRFILLPRGTHDLTVNATIMAQQ